MGTFEYMRHPYRISYLLQGFWYNRCIRFDHLGKWRCNVVKKYYLKSCLCSWYLLLIGDLEWIKFHGLPSGRHLLPYLTAFKGVWKWRWKIAHLEKQVILSKKIKNKIDPRIEEWEETNKLFKIHLFDEYLVPKKHNTEINDFVNYITKFIYFQRLWERLLLLQ